MGGSGREQEGAERPRVWAGQVNQLFQQGGGVLVPVPVQHKWLVDGGCSHQRRRGPLGHPWAGSFMAACRLYLRAQLRRRFYKKDQTC